MNTPCRHISKIDIGEFSMDVLFNIFGSFIVAFIVYGNNIIETYGYMSVFMASFFISLGFFLVIIDSGNRLGLLSSLGEFIAGTDPNEILLRCKFLGEEKITKDEKLEKAYSLAMERAYALFANLFVYWILLGIANAVLIYLGPPHWLTTVSIGVFSIAAFLSFVLWIISYLRYRDYSKKLFLLQLNKGKAEVAIKI